MLDTACSPAVGLAVYLRGQASLVAATTPTAQHSTFTELKIDRSYAGSTVWPGGWRSPTAVSSDVGPVLGGARVEDAVIEQIERFASLEAGWDGEQAAQASVTSVDSAIKFIRAAGAISAQLEPTVHSDGSVLLEIDGGARGSIRFNEDKTLSYAFAGIRPATVQFDGKTLPQAIRDALKT